MKKRKFVHKLRTALEIAVQFLVVVIIIELAAWAFFGASESIFRTWPIEAAVLLFYALMTSVEDYLDHRVFCYLKS